MIEIRKMNWKWYKTLIHKLLIYFFLFFFFLSIFFGKKKSNKRKFYNIFYIIKIEYNNSLIALHERTPSFQNF